MAIGVSMNLQSSEELSILAMRGALTKLPDTQKEQAKLFEHDVTKFMDDKFLEIQEKFPDYEASFIVALIIGSMESMIKMQSYLATKV